ncbi:MAG: hypothetical protein CM15mP49_15510 [Actinomycetota bacterium]|nr:MAG: hypothetical protein CM15mP49_15510 [Actinomycetota bacterium]
MESTRPFHFLEYTGLTFRKHHWVKHLGLLLQIGLPGSSIWGRSNRTKAKLQSMDYCRRSTLSDPITGYVVDAYKSSNNQINAGSCVTVTLTCSNFWAPSATTTTSKFAPSIKLEPVIRLVIHFQCSRIYSIRKIKS